MSSDNYQEEITLLIRQLKRPNFRFIIVRFNHYSVVTRVKQDLLTRFPDRPLVSHDCSSVSYEDIQDSFTKLENGFVCLDNFDSVLGELVTYSDNPANDRESTRRRNITSQLNLRRDFLAKHPNAFLLFVFARGEEKQLRAMMEQMPDMWSFRSLVLDVEVMTTAQESPAGGFEATRSIPEESVIANSSALRQRIEELREELDTVAPDSALALSLYPRLVEELEAAGMYAEAIRYAQQWEAYVDDAKRAHVLVKIGDLYTKIGKLTEALGVFERAYTIDVEQGNLLRQGLLSERIGSVLTERGNLSGAMEEYKRYLDISLKLLEQSPDDADLKNRLAISYAKLGGTHSSLGNLAKALEFFEQYSTLERELHAAYPDNVGFKNGLAISYAKLGETHSSLGNLAKALEFFEIQTKLFEELHRAYPDNVGFKNGLAISYSKLGETHSSLGNLAKALEFFEQYSTLKRELHAAYPDNVGFKNGLAISYSKLGETHSSLGNLAKALEFFEQYSTLERELHAAYPDNVGFKNGLAISYAKLGETHSSLGNLAKALEFFEQYSTLERELHAAYPDNVGFKNGLAISYAKLAQIAASENDKIIWFQKAEILWSELATSFPAYMNFQKFLDIVQKDLRNLED